MRASPARSEEVVYTNGVGAGAIVSGSQVRTYRIFVPAELPAGLVPLVIVLHGGALGSSFQIARNTGFDAEATAGGFIAVYPQGLANTWNAGTCCNPARDLAVDDVGFMRDLIDDLAARHEIDPARVYATGMSNGGMLAYRLGCELSDRIAAIAPVSATMVVSPCTPGRPVSVMHIHGLMDHNVNYEGGVGSDGLSKDSRPPVPSVVASWRAIDACPEPPVQTAAGAVATSTSEGCLASTGVTLITIADMGHTWPGGDDPTGAGGLVVDPPNNAIDATSRIWDFFAGHPRL